MAIVERDLQTGDTAFWHPKKNPQPETADYNYGPSVLLDVSPMGSLYRKTVEFKAVGADRVLVSVFVTRLDEAGIPIKETTQDIDEPYILSAEEINEANIVVGTKTLSYLPFPA